MSDLSEKLTAETTTQSDVTNHTISSDVEIFKNKFTIWKFEIEQSTNLATFSVGPIVIGINLNIAFGIPLNLTLELDGDVLFNVYIAGLAQAGVSVGMSYGVNWQRVWFFDVPVPYLNFYGDKSASADAIYFFDLDKISLHLNKCLIGVSIEPYCKIGLDVSLYSVIRGGFSFYTGLEGYLKAGYENMKLCGKTGLNMNSKIQANVYVGLKKVQLLFINLGDIGWGHTWDIINISVPIIPEISWEKKTNE